MPGSTLNEKHMFKTFGDVGVSKNVFHVVKSFFGSLIYNNVFWDGSTNVIFSSTSDFIRPPRGGPLSLLSRFPSSCAMRAAPDDELPVKAIEAAEHSQEHKAPQHEAHVFN